MQSEADRSRQFEKLRQWSPQSLRSEEEPDCELSPWAAAIASDSPSGVRSLPTTLLQDCRSPDTAAEDFYTPVKLRPGWKAREALAASPKLAWEAAIAAQNPAAVRALPTVLVASGDQGEHSTVDDGQTKVKGHLGADPKVASCQSWDFPLCRGDQRRRLILIFQKEANLREMQIIESEATVRHLCEEAGRLEAATEALACKAALRREAQKGFHGGLPNRRKRKRLRMRQLLRRRKASLEEERAVRAVAEQSQSIAAAELCWAKTKIESLQKENAWLRLHWASAVAPSAVTGLPPPPMRPVSRTPSPRRPRVRL